jgi:hypothetical protein
MAFSTRLPENSPGRIVFTALCVAFSGVTLVTGCAKKFPSGPGQPPGAAVFLRSITFVDKSRPVTISGLVLNQSGYTSYNVQIGMTVYRSYPTVFS